MRIGMMADMYKPHISGVTNFISLSKRFLEAQGHDVYVFTFGNENYPDDETNIIRSQGVPVLDTGFYFNISYNRHARNLIRTMDIVHVHHPFLSGSLAIRYCRPAGIPIVFTTHTRYDLYTQTYLPVPFDEIGETALQAYLPAFCRACDLVIAPSEGMRNVLVRFGVDVPIAVIPNGVDLKLFRRPVKARGREEFGFSAHDVLLIYVGRLGPEKNLSFLLRAFHGAAHAYEQARLLLVGDGPERSNLEDQVLYMQLSDKVRFTGLVPNEQIPGYLAMADAFVTASVTEVHPLSVIEAMACGLPVLGIRSPGIADTVENGVTGMLADEEDLASFTAKMARMISSPEERRQMGYRAAEEAEKYAIENTTQIMINKYQELIARSAGRRNSMRTRLASIRQRWSG